MTAFRVYILGCGSAMPTLRHNASAQVVDINDKLFLVDCGEGTQTQLRRGKVHFARINHIFISHLHGDHCLGLPGMISTFGMLGRTAPLHLYAPEALHQPLLMMLECCGHGLDYELVFHPVDTKRQQVIYEDKGLTIETIPLQHRMPCCGYLFREKPHLPHIRRDRMDALGISMSQAMRIKNGEDGVMPDGTVVPHQQLVLPAQQPRAYAYCSDTKYIPTLHHCLENVTTIYHESTYASEHQREAEKYMHSTALQAAMVARDAKVKQLVIGHFSSRYENEKLLLDEAKQVFPNTILADERTIIEV